jgi:hypothetical protein
MHGQCLCSHDHETQKTKFDTTHLYLYATRMVSHLDIRIWKNAKSKQRKNSDSKTRTNDTVAVAADGDDVVETTAAVAANGDGTAADDEEKEEEEEEEEEEGCSIGPADGTAAADEDTEEEEEEEEEGCSIGVDGGAACSDGCTGVCNGRPRRRRCATHCTQNTPNCVGEQPTAANLLFRSLVGTGRPGGVNNYRDQPEVHTGEAREGMRTCT